MTKDGQKSGGRRKGTPNKATAEIREILDEEVDFNTLVSKLFELVEGVSIEKYTPDGAIVYQEKPDAYAAKILLEYRYGKPLQTVNQNTVISATQKFKIGDQEITFD